MGCGLPLIAILLYYAGHWGYKDSKEFRLIIIQYLYMDICIRLFKKYSLLLKILDIANEFQPMVFASWFNNKFKHSCTMYVKDIVIIPYSIIQRGVVELL